MNRTSMNKNNSTGIRGVVFHKKSGKYMVRIQEKYVGLFKNISDAEIAMKKLI